MAEKVFPKGFIAFAPHSKAPDFVMGQLNITIEDAIQWLQTLPNELKSDYNGKAQVKLAILKGKDGKINLQVDTWKPTQKAEVSHNQPKDEPQTKDGLPF
jgi:hypothetical protein